MLSVKTPHKYVQDVISDPGGTTYTNRCICGKTKGHPVHQKKFRDKPITYRLWLENRRR